MESLLLGILVQSKQTSTLTKMFASAKILILVPAAVNNAQRILIL